MKKTLLLISLLFTCSLFSQNGEWARFLTLSRVYDIVSDPEYVWVATNAGLVQMNPLTYEKNVFTKENGLSGDEVRDLLYDSQGRLWAATDEGLSLWDGNEWLTQPIPRKFNKRECSSLTEDEQGIIWIGMNAQIALYDGNTYTAFNHIKIQSQVWNLFAHDGAVWMTLVNGDLWRLKDDILQLQLPFVDTHIRDLATDADGNLIVACQPYNNTRTTSLMKFDGKEWSPVSLPFVNPEASATAIESGCRDRLLIGTYGEGIVEYTRENVQRKTLSGLDSAYYPTAIHHDPYRNTMWIGTTSIWPQSYPEPKTDFYPVGLYELKSESSTAQYHYLSQNGFVEFTSVKALIPDEDGGMWIARFQQVFKYKNGDWKRWDFTNGIWEMRKDSQGRIWVSTAGGAGLYMIDEQGVHEVWVRTSVGLKGLDFGLYGGLDIQGDSAIYLGARVMDLSKYRIEEIQGNRVIVREEPQAILTSNENLLDYVRKIKVTQNGKVWLKADSDKLYHFDGNTWQGPVSSGLGSVRDIIEANDKIWFIGYIFDGRPGGISFTSDQDWSNIQLFDRRACPADEVSTGGLFIQDGTFYTAHTFGISIFDNQNACEYISEPFGDPPSNINGLALDKNGNIWFNKYHTLYVYNPEQLVDIVYTEGNSPTPSNEPGGWECVPELDLSKWNVYPNPSRNGIWVEKEFTEQENLEIRLLNYMGQALYSWDMEQVEQGDFRQYLDLSAFPSGNYLLQLISDSDTEVVKISRDLP